MSRVLLGVVVLLATFTAVGCDGSVVTAPTPPQVPNRVTESFSGTLTVNGAATYPFVVQTTGQVTAQLTTLTPNSEVQIGMALGTWNVLTETCSVVISSDLTAQGVTIIGTAQVSGTFCVRAYDVGRLTESTSYEITVIHQ